MMGRIILQCLRTTREKFCAQIVVNSYEISFFFLNSSTTISLDTMGRLARHMLNQRSYYPLYPPDESVPLDVGLWTDYGQMETTPHILIVPSEIRHFIKDVDKTVVVNPERLSKGNSGMYARLQIEVPDNSRLEDVDSIADIIKGQIVKI